jgi:hypothetical protein
MRPTSGRTVDLRVLNLDRDASSTCKIYSRGRAAEPTPEEDANRRGFSVHRGRLLCALSESSLLRALRKLTSELRKLASESTRLFSSSTFHATEPTPEEDANRRGFSTYHGRLFRTLLSLAYLSRSLTFTSRARPRRRL